MLGRGLFQERPLNVPHFKVGNADHYVCYVCVYIGGVGGGGGGTVGSRTEALGFESIATSPGCNRAAGSKAGRACTCALGGAGTAAGRQRPDLRRGQRGLLRGRRGVLDLCSRGSRGSLPHSAVGCKLCVRGCVPRASVHRIGREGAAAVASRLVGLVGLVDVLWRGSRQSPSRRPKQR